MGITMLRIGKYTIKRIRKDKKLSYDLYVDGVVTESSTLLDVLLDKIHIPFHVSVNIFENHGYLVQLEYDQTGRVYYDIYKNEQKLKEEHTSIDEALKNVHSRIACDIAQKQEGNPCHKEG